LCSQYQVQGYPSIKVFSDKGKVSDYKLERQASAIVRFATDQLPNQVVRIKDTTALANFLQEGSQIPHVLIFSSKADVAPLLKSLAVSYKGRLSFGIVKQDAKEIVAKYSIETFPKILVLKGEEEPVVYEGSISPEELSTFIAGFAGESVAQEAAPPPPPKARPIKTVLEVSYEEVTVDNIDTVCQGLCILGFVDVESTEDKRTVKADQQHILDGILSSFKSDGKFKFGWVDKLTQKGLVEKFSLAPDQPALLVFNGKRQRFAKSEHFNHKSCFTMIEHVLTGDATYSSL